MEGRVFGGHVFPLASGSGSDRTIDAGYYLNELGIHRARLIASGLAFNVFLI